MEKKKAKKKASVKKVKSPASKKSAPKKSVVKRSVFKKPDVPKLLDIFENIKNLMKPYESKLNARIDIQGKYDLWSEKEVEAFGRRYDSMAFAAAIIQSGYVGFYFMPVYGEPEMKKVFDPEFLKLLKGKSCFHIKEFTPQTKKWISSALKEGFAAYKKKGWI